MPLEAGRGAVPPPAMKPAVERGHGVGHGRTMPRQPSKGNLGARAAINGSIPLCSVAAATCLDPPPRSAVAAALRQLRVRASAKPRALCPECWSAIEFLSSPACSRCGYPFEFEVEGATLCAACQRSPRPCSIGRARCCAMTTEAATCCWPSSMATAPIWHLSSAAGWREPERSLLAERRSGLSGSAPLDQAFRPTIQSGRVYWLSRRPAEAHRPFMPDVLCRRRRTPPQRSGPSGARCAMWPGPSRFAVRRRDGRRRAPGPSGGRRAHDRRDARFLRPGAEGCRRQAGRRA